MLFRQAFLAGIRAGRIDLAFRRWTKASVKAGGTLLTPIGQLAIGDVRVVQSRSITEQEARRAGFATRAELLTELDARTEGDIHRVELGALSVDPRIALRARAPDAAELDELQKKLARLDAREPWTRKVLELIAAHPGERAADLCARIGREKADFKLDVRKLKALGLTESLGTGYRIAPRGTAVLRATSPKRAKETKMATKSSAEASRAKSGAKKSSAVKSSATTSRAKSATATPSASAKTAATKQSTARKSTTRTKTTTRPAESVESYFATLEHPHKRGIEALRDVLLAADPAITEEMKWNVPSFRTKEHFATMHLRAKQGFGLILHFGAKKNAIAKTGVAIADPHKLLDWLAKDRALVSFTDLADLKAKRTALTKLVRAWYKLID